MSFVGEAFSSEIIGKAVLDPRGEDIGRVRDMVIVGGEPMPKVSGLVVERKKTTYLLAWRDLSIFNKKIISTRLSADMLSPYETGENDLLIVRDMLDKQVVDVNGAKVVRVNDVKLEGFKSEAVLVAVDVGLRGILRRLRVERGGEDLLRLFRKSLPYTLISWQYLQPIEPKLSAISLTVPRQKLSELHPADIAEIISSVSQKEGANFIDNLDVETAAEAISELQSDMQADIITAMDADKAADIIEEMQPDDAADILSDIPADKAKAILENIEKEEAADIQELLSHEEDTAGGLMTNEFIAFTPLMTVLDAAQKFREVAREIETVHYLYVLDKDEKLVGITSLREFLLAEPDCLLADIMETNLKTVSPQDDQMDAAAIISKYNLLAVPVVDEEGHMHGIVTVDDIIDIILPTSARKKQRKV